MKEFDTIDYGKINHLQVGKFSEYWVKTLLIAHGFDIYTSEIDDKAIDFVIRLDGAIHVDVQVKSVRLIRANSSYVFITKGKKTWSEVDISRKNLYLALVLLRNGSAPKVYLIPAMEWKNSDGNLLVNRDYLSTQKSKSEWGINISLKNAELLEKYNFLSQIEGLKAVNDMDSIEKSV